jgi:hypothetical protein
MKKKAKRYQEGGEAEDKRRGLKASEGEKVGFLERLRMGNIDDPTSEAYKRLGAGRGRATASPDMTPYSETEDAKNLMKAAKRDMAQADTDVSGMERYAKETGIGTLRQPAKAMPSGPAAKASPTRATPSVPSSPRGSFRGTQEEGDEGEDIARQAMARRVSDVDTEIARLDKRGKKTPEGKTATGLPREARSVKNPGPFLNTGYSEYERIRREGKQRRAESGEKVPARPSRALSTPASRKAWDEKYGDKYDSSGNRKPGMKAGGMVKSGASKRADGIATKGKTRGRII